MPSGRLPRPPIDRTVPMGFRIGWDPRTAIRSGGRVLLGGSPWRLSRLPDQTREFVALLRASGPGGRTLTHEQDRAIARVLLDRGFAFPLAPGTAATGSTVSVVIPVLDRVDGVQRLLRSGIDADVVVVDDGSSDPAPLADVAKRFGATLVRHQVNRGPAAARNTGVRVANSEFIAFIDSDCTADDDWPTSLLWHFADPGVAVVAPRVVPGDSGSRVLARFERARSALDMGRRPELVAHGARLGFVPSAALVVRRSALGEAGFDEGLRLGEDVDLVWRLGAAGWQVRYDPGVRVRHHGRERVRDWLRRGFEYGTSAADIDARHPGRLVPARLAAWNLVTLGLLAQGRPLPAAVVTTASALLLARQLDGVPGGPALASETVARGVLADAAQVGRLLRREWWPIGVATLALAPRSRWARLGAACMLVPIAQDYVRERPALDPVRYAGLQLLADAAYGSGVIASSVSGCSWRPLTPQVRLPRLPTMLLRRRTGRSGP